MRVPSYGPGGTTAQPRRVLGWRAATTMKTQLVLDALEMAIWIRGTIHALGGLSIPRLAQVCGEGAEIALAVTGVRGLVDEPAVEG